ncbi:hypothetical protein ACSBR1_027872 [Camellia fascicularis]
MHDLLQELGQSIVWEQSRKKPGKRTRLWLDEDIKRVLMDNTLRPKAFAKMSNLWILKICCRHLLEELKYLCNKLRYLEWLGYPMKYMLSTFQPKHLVELHLTYSSIEQLWEGTMHLDELRIMDLSHSTYLTKSPDFTRVPNLKRLILEGCTGLVNLHPSIGVLRRLTCLNLKDCKSLKSLPCGIQLESLEVFIASGCSKLDNVLVSLGYMNCLSKLCLDGTDWTAIRQLPSSIGLLKKLGILTLKGERDNSMAFELEALSGLKSSWKLDLSYCNLKSIPTAICHIDSLVFLDLSGNNMQSLPASMNQLSRLSGLVLNGCKKLQELPKISSGIHGL